MVFTVMLCVVSEPACGLRIRLPSGSTKVSAICKAVAKLRRGARFDDPRALNFTTPRGNEVSAVKRQTSVSTMICMGGWISPAVLCVYTATIAAGDGRATFDTSRYLKEDTTQAVARACRRVLSRGRRAARDRARRGRRRGCERARGGGGERRGGRTEGAGAGRREGRRERCARGGRSRRDGGRLD